MQLSAYPAPFERLSPRSARGGALLLRIEHRGRWLRVHDDGDVEDSIANARSEIRRRPLPRIAVSSDLFAGALSLHERLLRALEPRSLETPCIWNRWYAVQAFAESRVVEGYVGLETDMGCVTDIFGLRENSREADVTMRLVAPLLDLMPAQFPSA